MFSFQEADPSVPEGTGSNVMNFGFIFGSVVSKFSEKELPKG